MDDQDLEFNELKEIMSGDMKMSDVDKRIETAMNENRAKRQALKEEIVGLIEKEAKKGTEFDKSPVDHGFMDECIEKNKDKGKEGSGAYCAAIVDRAKKGDTSWRGEGREKKKESKESKED
jgi:hypothetical protein